MLAISILNVTISYHRSEGIILVHIVEHGIVGGRTYNHLVAA